MTPLDYDFLRKCLKERSGLVLSADKQYLVDSRLLPVARKAGLTNLGELVAKLKDVREPALMSTVVEAMTTNEVFYRDKTPFDHFRVTHHAGAVGGAQKRAHHPYLVRRRLDRAGALFAGDVSQGDGIRDRRLAHRLLATDLSSEVLEKARRVSTPSSRCSAGCRSRLSSNISPRSANCGRSRRYIRAMVRYRQPNLLADFSQLGQFHRIFCRNVLIYFDHDQDRRAQPAGPGHRQRRLSGARRRRNRIGLTDRFKMVPDKRGLYAPNANPSRLSSTGAATPPPRLFAISGGR